MGKKQNENSSNARSGKARADQIAEKRAERKRSKQTRLGATQSVEEEALEVESQRDVVGGKHTLNSGDDVWVLFTKTAGGNAFSVSGSTFGCSDAPPSVVDLLGMGLRLPWKCSGALWGGDVGYWPYLSISLPHVVENCGEQ